MHMFWLCFRYGTTVNWRYLFLYINLFVCCRSGTDRRLTQYYFYCVLPVWDRPSLRRRLCLAQEVEYCPNFLFAISLYRVSGPVTLRLAIMGGRRLVSSLENSWPAWGHCLFLHQDYWIRILKSNSLVHRGFI